MPASNFKNIVVLLFSCLLYGCSHIPEGVRPVVNFDGSRYLGKWYEIARMDHSFERGLTRVYAVYSLRSDGGIDVMNYGYDKERCKWKTAQGRAYFSGPENVGQLEVTFFWPFYGAYNVIALDERDYSYAMVCGSDRSYLWILCREPRMNKSTLSGLVARAAELGFDTSRLIYVEQM